MTMVMVEQMVASIERIIEMLDAVPEDQRTTAMKVLLEGLQHAVGDYEIKKAEAS